MALVTLPYPNMDFVPLDVLTANELDQLVANIEAVNNAQITSAQISNSTITAPKMDFTTFYKTATSLSTDMSVPADTRTTVQTMTLPAGTWRVFFSIRAYYASSSTTVASTYLVANSEDAGAVTVNVPTQNGTGRFVAQDSEEITLTSSSTVASQVNQPVAGYVSPNTTYMFAIRVG